MHATQHKTLNITLKLPITPWRPDRHLVLLIRKSLKKLFRIITVLAVALGRAEYPHSNYVYLSFL